VLIAVLTLGGSAFRTPSAAAVDFTCSLGAFFQPCVSVRPDGITPSDVTLLPGQGVWFAGESGDAVTWDGSACVDRVLSAIPPPDSAPCRFELPGRYTFHVGGFTGTATVTEPEWITITTPSMTVDYGDSLALTGTSYVSPHYGGPPPPPIPVFVAGRTLVGAGSATSVWAFSGAWSVNVRPARTTWYHAHAHAHHSGEVRIDVRPQLVLRRSGGRLVVQPTPRKPFSRRVGGLQRRLADGSWRTVSTFRFNSEGIARLRHRLPRGAVVRAYLPALGDVYADASSVALTIR